MLYTLCSSGGPKLAWINLVSCILYRVSRHRSFGFELQARLIGLSSLTLVLAIINVDGNSSTEIYTNVPAFRGVTACSTTSAYICRTKYRYITSYKPRPWGITGATVRCGKAIQLAVRKDAQCISFVCVESIQTCNKGPIFLMQWEMCLLRPSPSYRFSPVSETPTIESFTPFIGVYIARQLINRNTYRWGWTTEHPLFNVGCFR